MVRGRSLPRNVEAPPALPITTAEPTSAVPSWISSGGASASPLLKRAQLNGASMAAKEEVNKVNYTDYLYLFFCMYVLYGNIKKKTFNL